jgi:hypothetical protein
LLSSFSFITLPSHEESRRVRWRFLSEHFLATARREVATHLSLISIRMMKPTETPVARKH